MTQPTRLSQALTACLPESVLHDLKAPIDTPGPALEQALHDLARDLWDVYPQSNPLHDARCLLLARWMELGTLPDRFDALVHVGIDRTHIWYSASIAEAVLVPLAENTAALGPERSAPLRRHALQALLAILCAETERLSSERLERLDPARGLVLDEAAHLLNAADLDAPTIHLPTLKHRRAASTSRLIRLVLDLGGPARAEPFLARLAWGNPRDGRVVLDALDPSLRDGLLDGPDAWPLLRTFAGMYPSEARFAALFTGIEAAAERVADPNALQHHITGPDFGSPEAQRALLRHLGDTPARAMGVWAMAFHIDHATPHPRFARAFAALWTERIDAHLRALELAWDRDDWLPAPWQRSTGAPPDVAGFYSSTLAMRTWPDEAVAPAFDALLTLPVERWAFCAVCASLAHRALSGIGQDAPVRAAAALKRLQHALNAATDDAPPRVTAALAHAHMAAHHGSPDWEAYAAAFDAWIDHGTFPDTLAPQTHARRAWLERLRARFLNARAEPNATTLHALDIPALVRNAGTEPWNALVAVRFLNEPGARYKPRYISAHRGLAYKERFPTHATTSPALRAAARAILRTQRLRAWMKPLHDTVCAHPTPDDLTLHIRLLQNGSKTLAEAARWQLVEVGEDAVEALTGGLQGDKKSRLATAQCLERIASPNALPALQARLKRERNADVKAALNAAIDACDPRVSVIASGFDAGVYPITAPSFDANLALAHLRAAVYAEPSRAAWVRLCDAVERARRVGALDVALDYVRHGLDAWPMVVRSRPHHWVSAPELRALCAPPGRGHFPWLPVSALHDAETVARALTGANARCRARLLTPDDCLSALPLLERAWQWCQDHQLPVTALTLRFDAGTKGGPNATSSAMELYHGFGVSFSRARAMRKGSRTAAVQRLNVTIPGDRSDLRDRYQLSARKRTLDLLPILADPSV